MVSSMLKQDVSEVVFLWFFNGMEYVKLWQIFDFFEHTNESNEILNLQFID